jgi:heat shock protein HtpX
MTNVLKTTVLLGAMTGLLLMIGELIGGGQGLIFGFVIAVVMNFGSYWFSDKIVLRMYSATEVGPGHRLYESVTRLAQRAGLPQPRCYTIPDASPNAFATGRNPQHAAVAATEGILQILDNEELEGVLAHELSHVRNYDVRLMTYAAVLAGSIALIAQIFLRAMWFSGGDRDRNANPIVLVVVIAALVLAPVAAVLIQFAISRKREFVADASAAELTRYPQGLASALQVISSDSKPSAQLGNPAIAHMMIVAPLSVRGRSFKLFSTHPPAEERIAVLEKLAGGVQHRHETLTEGRALPEASAAA